ncbi:hypothetical protein MRB53_033774 [Persea americana]|uniref:Uncharacterized protein n=1 Tax=Persea americana TaxID=3435 RepID=A0ACC2KWU1_PERAE|nr:hypothetical protein MRB53_033774 [Persea americana]
MSFFLDILRCVLCCEEDGYEDRDYSRYEVLSQRSSSPVRVFEQRRPPSLSPSTPSIQPRYAYGSDYWNQAPIASVREEPARKSQPKQPEIYPNPMRFVTHTTTPSVSQRNSVDSVLPSTISIHSTKPSTLSTSVSSKIPINSKGLDSVSQRSSVASICPPTISVLSTKPATLSSSESAEKPIRSNVLGLPKKPSAEKPSALSGSDPPKKPHASSGSDPPKRPNASPVSDPPKKPSGSNVLPVYQIPGEIKHVIEKDQIPEVLKKKHVSSSNYADYFAALLYAEDYYMEKWSEFLENYVLSGITLRLREETKSGKSRKSNKKVYMNQMAILESNKEEKKVYVEFDMDSIPERRPFLLAKDYVYVRRSGKTVKPFQGFLSRVEKSKLLVAEFGKDFHAQHSLMNKYDVWFDFNRVCLKRSHQGVAAAVDPSFRVILFPERVSRSRRQIPIFTVPFNRNLDQVEMSAVNQILSLKGPPPYLIVESSLPRSHGIIVEAILQIYRTFKESRILIVAPQNHTCDLLIIRLKEEISVSELFRANAAFRERDEVPKDVLSSSLYEGECFTCPPSKDLRKFKVISSTFVSSFRLHCHGIYAGHFSHIFVVDACYATEPETMVTLANLANESTTVVLTGSSEHYARWVRSDIARANGLRRSYFKRLLESEPYKSRDPDFVKYL